ncbi:hypothetical protein [Gloeothece verrucosa]|uniref:Uncharacterized protein n=1 Tax=Gloeothece verrucosa (strain PCC 7822) TaxID=497965 RepID=E0UAH5_GLOV7|nr:hypothetical protein [Gloeothece verrucosa]ADN12716.1 hypothetical protein Cyan7822_0680 [Gloeothece verrucosa PCC 7822]
MNTIEYTDGYPSESCIKFKHFFPRRQNFDFAILVLSADDNELNTADITLLPLYNPNGSQSTPLKIWLLNGLEEDNEAEIGIGHEIALYNKVDEDPSLSAALSGGILIDILGLVRRATGELDENFPDVGRYIFTAGEYLFALNAAIPRGYALACQIIYKISAAQLTFARIFLGSTIKSWIYARKPLGIIVPGLAAIAGDKYYKDLPADENTEDYSFAASSSNWQNDYYEMPDPEAEEEEEKPPLKMGQISRDENNITIVRSLPPEIYLETTSNQNAEGQSLKNAIKQDTYNQSFKFSGGLRPPMPVFGFE